MKNKAQIQIDLAASSKRRRGFYIECLRIIEACKPEFLQFQLATEKKILAKMLKRKNQLKKELLEFNTYASMFKQLKPLYKAEIRTARRHIAGLKYILDEKPKKQTGKSSRKSTNYV